MDNKVLFAVFILFIIYLACKKNIIKGGENIKIVPGDIEGKYERVNPTPGNSYHYITFSRKGKGFVWTLKSNFGWYVDENLIPTGDNYVYKNKDWAGKKINIKMNENKEVIGLTSSEGEYFNRVGDLKNSVKKMEELKKYSVLELEKALDIKKIQNKLNNMPKIHSKMTNYELYLQLGNNEGAYNIIKNGTYWADKAFQLKNDDIDYNNVIETPLLEREKKFYSIQNSYNIKDTLQKQNEMKNEKMMDNEKMMNNEKMMGKNNTVLCPNKSEKEFCDGKADCWKTNFCECPEAQKLCKKNIMKDFNINNNEEVERILNIFHGNSIESSKIDTPYEPEKEGQYNPEKDEPYTPENAANFTDTATSPNAAEYPAVADINAEADIAEAKTAAEVDIDKAVAEAEAKAKAAAEAKAKAAAEARVNADIAEAKAAEAKANAEATTQMFTGGMNESDDDMEILNKFHGGSINYEKF